MLILSTCLADAQELDTLLIKRNGRADAKGRRPQRRIGIFRRLGGAFPNHGICAQAFGTNILTVNRPHRAGMHLLAPKLGNPVQHFPDPPKSTWSRAIYWPEFCLDFF